MYRYKHVYIQTCIRTNIYAYIHTVSLPPDIRESTPLYAHIIHTYIHVYIQTYIYTNMYTYIHVYIHAYIHTWLRTCIHTNMYTYIHTYIHTYSLSPNRHSRIYAPICTHNCSKAWFRPQSRHAFPVSVIRYIYIYKYMYVYIYVCMYVCMYVCICVYTYIVVNADTHAP